MISSIGSAIRSRLSFLAGRRSAAVVAAVSTIAGFTYLGVAQASGSGTGYTTPVTNDNPAVYYRLDESAGTTAADSSGNGLTATFGTNGSGGGITYGVPGALTDSQDVADTAITADGSVTVPVTSNANLPISGDSAWTMEGWYRSTSGNPQTLVSFGTAGTEQAAGLSVWPSAGGQPGYRLGLDLHGSTVEWDGTNLNDGHWHQLAVSYTGGGTAAQPGFAAYVDGQPLGNGSLSSVTFPLQIAAGPVLVGGWTDTGYEKPLNGSMDEVAVYPSAVSASDIAAQYKAAGVRPGRAAKVAVSLSSPSIPADGTTTTTVTATVTDATGNAVDGDSLTIASSDTKQTLPASGAMTDTGNGVYTATVTASKAASPATVTVTDNTPNPKISGTATLTETPTAAVKIALSASPASIPADGKSVATVTATVTDANGNPVPGQTLGASSSDTGETIGTLAGGNDGSYTIPVTSSTTAGSPTITVTDGSATATATLVQYAPGTTTSPACTDIWSGKAGDNNWATATNWDAASDATVHNAPTATDVACLPATPAESATPTSYTVNVLNNASVASVVVGSAAPATGAPTTQTLAVVSQSNSSTTFNLNGGLVQATGAIDLTNNSGYNGPATVVTVGPGYTLTNQGTITVDPGNGGSRYWNGSVVNQGAYTANVGITFGPAGSTFDNQGTLTVAAGQQFLVPSVSSGQPPITLIDDHGGVITGAGNVNVYAGDAYVQGDGVVTTATPPLVSGGGGLPATIDYTGGGAGTIDAHDAVTVAGNLVQGQDLELNGTSNDNLSATLAGDVTNAGTIDLTDDNNYNGSTSLLYIPAGATLTNTGTLTSAPGAGGSPRYIRGNVVNTGTVTVGYETHFDQAAATFDQQGAFAANALFLIPLNQSGSASSVTFKDTAGQITTSNGAYIFEDGGNRWIQGDGSIAATAQSPYIQGWVGGPASSQVIFTGSGATTLTLRDKVQITGDVGSSQHLQIQAQSNDSAVVAATGSFANNGSIELTSISSYNGPNAYLQLPAGAVMTNVGTLVADPSNGYSRYIEGSVLNTGTVVINEQTYFDQAGATFDNKGSLALFAGFDVPTNGAGIGSPLAKTFIDDTGGDVGGSATLSVDPGNRYVQGNGTISDTSAPVISGSGNGITAGLTYTGTGAGTILTRDQVMLSGNIAAGQNVVVQAQSNDTAYLHAPSSFTNAGSIELTSINGYNGPVSVLDLYPGATLSNTGTLLTDPSNGNNRYIRGSVVNTGTVTVNETTIFDQAGATFDNQGTLTLGAQLQVAANGHGTTASETFKSTSGTIAATGSNIYVGYGDTWVQGAGTLTTGSQHVTLQGGNGIPAGITMQGSGSVDIDAIDLTSLSGNLVQGQTINVLGQANETATMNAAGSFTNAGVIDLTNNSGYNGPQSILALPSGATLTNSGTLQADPGQGGSRQINGSIDNTGTVLVSPGVALPVNGAFANTGTVNVGSGSSLTLSQAPTNVSGTTLPATWDLGGNVSWPGAAKFTTIAGTVQRAGGTIVDSKTNADALAAVSEVSPGADLQMAGVTVADSASLSNDGTLDLSSTDQTSADSVFQPAGYTQSDSGQLDVTVNSLGASNLSPADGTAVLAGTLDVTTLTRAGAPPATGTRYQIMATTSTPTGQFKTVKGVDTPGQADYAVTYESTGVWLTVSNPTTTALASSAANNTSDYGTPVTLTATVTGTSAPTGSVVFTDSPAGGSPVQLCAATPVTGADATTATATCAVPALPAGTHSISAVFSDPTLGFGGSTGTLTETVDQVATTTVATATTPAAGGTGTPVTTVEFGTPVTLGATVAPASGSGSLDGANKVSFSVADNGDQGTSPTGCANLPLATGAASCTAATVAVGSESMTASYLGDANSQASTSAPVAFTVTPRATSATLTSSATPAIAGQALTLTFTAVAGDSPPASLEPTGTVSFFDGSALNPNQAMASCAGVALSGGIATCVTKTLTPGSHTITASYSDPAGNFSPAQATLQQDVAHSGLTLDTSGSPSTYGKTVTFTANLTGSGTMGGNVTFTDSLNGAAPVTVCSAVAVTPGAAGQASTTCSPANLAVGIHQVTASYSGDTANEAAAGQATVQVQPRATTVTVTSSKASSTIGDPVTFTATISGGTGSITFTDQMLGGAATTLCGPSVAVTGTIATCKVSNLAVGTHTITAAYSGDANDTPADASTGQSVQTAVTNTSLTISGGTLTATVTGGLNPTGTVTFTDISSSGSTVLCQKALSGGGATCSVTSLGTGGHALVASYSGDASNAPSTATISDGVPRATTATAVALTGGHDPATTGDSLTFTAQVTGGNTPTGTVTFSDVTPAGTTTLCPAQPLGTGTVTCVTSTLAAGGHSIVAIYSGDANNLTSTGSTVETVDPLAKSASATTLHLTSGTDPAVIGTSLSVEADVTASPAPTGSVTFSVINASGVSTACLSVTVSKSGTADCQLPSLPAGANAITATYSGDSNDAGSTGAITETVTDAQTTTTVAETTGTNPSTSGDNLTFTATVANGQTPTGKITFEDVTGSGTTVICPAVALTNGTATCLVSTLGLGGHAIVASYSGDQSNQASVGATSQTVQASGAAQASTTTVASSTGTSAAPPGSSVTFTATVSGTGTPTGRVDFIDVTPSGSTSLCSGVALSGGSAPCQVSTLASGAHAIVANYSGDAANSASTGTTAQEVAVPTLAAPTVALSRSGGSANSTYGDPLTFVAQLSGGSAPSGTVTFTDTTPAGGETTLCPTVNLTGGTAQCVVTDLAPGSHAIAAVYSGDSANSPAASPTLVQAVSQAPTTTTLTRSTGTESSTVNSPLDFTAQVSGTATPSGTVTFTATSSSGSITVCADVALTTGVATCDASALPVGTYALVAAYSGDTDNAPSTGTADQAVTPAPLAKTVTAVAQTTGTDPSVTGDTIAFTATVSGGSSPTGTVDFDYTTPSGTSPLCTGVTLAKGQVTCTDSTLAAGSYAIVATYSGDSSNSGSSGTTAHTVNPSPKATTTTAIALSSGTNPSTYQSALTFTATVSGGSTPTGTVTFTAVGPNGTVNLCANPVTLASGSASCTNSNLAVGAYAIQAAYSGDAANAGSSATTSQAVDQPALAATGTALGSSANPSTAGNPVTFTATVTGGSSPTGTVTFTDTSSSGGGKICSDVALNKGSATCVTTPTQLAAGSHAITATYSGDTTNATSSATIAQEVDPPAKATSTVSMPLDKNGPNPSVSGNKTTFSAVVTGTGALSGSVTFVDTAQNQSPVTLCSSVALDATDTATCSTTALTNGAHAISAVYSGDGTHSGNSATFAQMVTPASTYANACTSATLVQDGSSLAASAAGCPNPQFEFLQYQSSSWQVVQAYSTKSTLALPTSPGTYNYAVWVKDASAPSTVAFYDVYAVRTVDVTASPCAVSLSVPQSVSLGQKATVTATPQSGYCTGATYQFLVQPQGGSWQTLGVTSTSNSVTWTPAAQGTYYFYVEVSAGGVGGSPVNEPWATVPPATHCSATPNITISPVSAATASSYAPGQQFTVSATESGCSNPLFEFFLQDPATNGNWLPYNPKTNTFASSYSLSDFSSTRTITWSSSGVPEGTAYWYVQVRDQSDTSGYLVGNSTQVTLVSNVACTKPAGTPTAVRSGSQITITQPAAGSCSHPEYLYMLWNSNNPSNGWVTVPISGSASNYTTSPSLVANGYGSQYTWVEIWVRHQGYNREYDYYQMFSVG